MKYPAYPEYVESGVEWIGKVPEHWQVLSIKRLTPVCRGASPRPIEDPKYFEEEGEYAWVRIADVTSNQHYLRETTQRLSELGKSLSVPLAPGSLFLSIAGSVGKPMITAIPACIHDGFVYFPDLSISTEFLYYIFESRQPFLGLGKLGTQLNLNTDTVGAVKIGLPPRVEQDLIVEFLRWRTAQIDALIAKKRTLITKLQEQRITVITQAVTEGLNSAVSTHDSGVDWLGKLPQHWGAKRLRFLVDTIEQGWSPRASAEPAGEGEWGVLKLSAVNGGRFEAHENKHLEELPENQVIQTPQRHDVLLTRANTPSLVGDVCSVQRDYPTLVVPDLIYRLKVDLSKTDERFIVFFFLSKRGRMQVESQARGSSGSMIKLGQGHVKDFWIPQPPLSEQRRIVEYLEAKSRDLDTMIEKVMQVISTLTEYRTALITAATTGKIDVRNVKVPTFLSLAGSIEAPPDLSQKRGLER